MVSEYWAFFIVPIGEGFEIVSYFVHRILS